MNKYIYSRLEQWEVSVNSYDDTGYVLKVVNSNCGLSFTITDEELKSLLRFGDNFMTTISNLRGVKVEEAPNL